MLKREEKVKKVKLMIINNMNLNVIIKIKMIAEVAEKLRTVRI